MLSKSFNKRPNLLKRTSRNSSLFRKNYSCDNRPGLWTQKVLLEIKSYRWNTLGLYGRRKAPLNLILLNVKGRMPCSSTLKIDCVGTFLRFLFYELVRRILRSLNRNKIQLNRNKIQRNRNKIQFNSPLNASSVNAFLISVHIKVYESTRKVFKIMLNVTFFYYIIEY